MKFIFKSFLRIAKWFSKPGACNFIHSHQLSIKDVLIMQSVSSTQSKKIWLYPCMKCGEFVAIRRELREDEV